MILFLWSHLQFNSLFLYINKLCLFLTLTFKINNSLASLVTNHVTEISLAMLSLSAKAKELSFEFLDKKSTSLVINVDVKDN